MEYLLWVYLILWPIYNYFTHEQEKQDIIDQPAKRIRTYQLTMTQQWIPTFMLLVLILSNQISTQSLGLVWQWDIASQIGVAGLMVVGGYFLLSLKNIYRAPESHEDIRQQLKFIQWFMPRTVKESQYFILGISITAGICEELIYRAYLIYLLNEFMPIYGAVFLSSLAFGLGHIYQGPIHIIRTAMMGVVMASIYLATDSIIIPIILHVLLDMYGGALAYIVLKEQPKAC